MHPVVLWHPRVTGYGAMLALAWLVGWWLARRRAVHVGISRWHIDWLMPLLVLGMLAGSRCAGRLCQLLSPNSSNDRVLLGAIVAAVAVVVLYAALARLPLGRIADAFGFSLPAGIAVLRVGCLLAGCCWGERCSSGWPIGMTYPAGSPAYDHHQMAGLLPAHAERSLPVHPVPLYEAGAMLGLLGVLILLDRRGLPSGESFLAFGLGYCLLRFPLEWFRADNISLVCGLTVAQVASFCGAGVCAAVWFARRRLSAKRTNVTATGVLLR